MEKQGEEQAHQASSDNTKGTLSMNGGSGPMASIQNSQLGKIILIGFLILLLQIPIVMIGKTIEERKYRSKEAATEVTSKWGKTQHVMGPFITIPYEIGLTTHTPLPLKTWTRLVSILSFRWIYIA